MKNTKIVNIINEICEEKDYISVDANSTNFSQLKFREDLGFDSFDLAQLTVMIEDEFDIDIFEDGIIETIGEIITKINS
jgi:acyl carrier protein